MSMLSHIKVLDLSRILAGPWASQILADLGAEVIKIENPQGGDDTRKWGPPYMPDSSGENSSESAYFLSANRGKKSVCIDIRSEQGQADLRELASQCDVVIENFKVGSAAKYGLDYHTLSAHNPGLVYCSITGFGQTGPYASRLGYDFLIQAMGGLMSITGEADSAGGSPQKAGVAVSDIMTGLYATIGIQAALLERERSQLGQYIDLSLLDVTAAVMANQASNYLIGGELPERLGNRHPNIVPYQTFVTADGYCVIAVGNDSQFESFCELLGCAELSQHPDYSSNKHRVKNRNTLIPLLQEKMQLQTSQHWLQACESAGVPAGPVNSIADTFADPQIQAREMCTNVPHPLNPDLSLVANPLKFSRTPISYHTPPPMLGEHTEEVLESLRGKSK